jgi:hypothetical protein
VDLFLTVAIGVVYLVFVFRVWSDFGFLWALGCLIFPPVSLLILYQGWSQLRGIFFLELVLIVARSLI